MKNIVDMLSCGWIDYYTFAILAYFRDVDNIYLRNRRIKNLTKAQVQNEKNKCLQHRQLHSGI